jgi:GNAT superfamily N-acetyltransferase
VKTGPEPFRDLTVEPLTSARWPDLVDLFGKTGADGGCWCMFYRLGAAGFGEWSATANRAALEAIADRDPAPGLLAYADGLAVGWCGLGPREEFIRLERSRHLGRVDDMPVWSLVCFFIRRGARSRGVARHLLAAAVEYARDHGAPALEAYPLDVADGPVNAKAAYPGSVAMFEAAGFQRVRLSDSKRGGVRRWIVRRELHGSGRPDAAIEEGPQPAR